MKKFLFVIGLSLGAYSFASAQAAAASASSSTGSDAPKAACCQKGGEAKACCAKDAKATSASAGCAGHNHHAAPKAEATTPATDKKGKDKAKSKTSSL